MYQYPPPMMWGGMPPNDDQFQRGMRLAMKIAQREEREKERKKNNEKKDREEARKRATATRTRFWFGIEVFIFGILAQPFVVPLYNHLLTVATKAN